MWCCAHYFNLLRAVEARVPKKRHRFAAAFTVSAHSGHVLMPSLMASMIGMDRSRREQHRGLWAAARVREDGQSGVNLGARQIADGWARVYVFAGNPSNPSIDNSVLMTPCAAATRAVTLSPTGCLSPPER